MHKRRLHTLGVTPATDTSSPPSPDGKISASRTAIVITLAVLAIGGLWWLNELDDKDND